MPEESDNQKPNFHEFALNSALFKGRPDFYFSYLKAERLSHAISKLSRFSGDVLENLLRASSNLPGALARFAAGEIEEAGILADIFEILSLLRLSVTQELISEGNARILVEEYEGIGHKIDLGKHASPFIVLEDLAIPPLRLEASKRASALAPHPSSKIKDIRQPMAGTSQGHAPRTSHILAFIRKQGRVSIKDISKVVRGVSEKTIQRELLELVRQGLVRKEGERRWSHYIPL